MPLRKEEKKIGSRTTPHEDNSPPDKTKAQPLPTRTTIPRTIPHQDNSPLGPLPRNHWDQNLYGGELSSWGVVRIRRKSPDCDALMTSSMIMEHQEPTQLANSFFPDAISNWNNPPQDVVKSKSTDGFKTKLHIPEALQ